MKKSNAAASFTPSQYSLKVLSGTDAGQVFPLTSSKVSIGRAQDNDIVFSSDPKISRRHVMIDLESDTPKVIDVSGKNMILVNGEQHKEASIDSGARIQIGDQELEFQVISTEAINVLNQEHPQQEGQLEPLEGNWNPQQAYIAPAPVAEPPQAPPPNDWAQTAPTPERNPKKGNRLRFYLSVAAIAGLFWFLLSDTGGKPEDRLQIRTKEEILKEAELAKERKKKHDNLKAKQGKQNRQYDEAQASYVRCFRDYRQAQYNRAIQHCQAALSLFPKHELAERYLILSKRKRDEKTQYLLRKGRLYRERGFFKMCMSTLKTVMYDIKDPKNITFKEARQLYAECRGLAEDRY